MGRIRIGFDRFDGFVTFFMDSYAYRAYTRYA